MGSAYNTAIIKNINDLPPEILLSVFRGICRRGALALELVPLTLVCRQWYTILVETLSLWCLLDLAPASKVCTPRSNSLPLHVQFAWDAAPTLPSWLREESCRIRVLDLSSTSYQSYLSLENQFSALERLSVRSHKPLALECQVENIRQLSLYRTTMDWSSISNLTHLSLSHFTQPQAPPSHALISFLQRNTHLQHISLASMNLSSVPTGHKPRIRSAQGPTAALHNLQSFVTNRMPPHFIHDLIDGISLSSVFDNNLTSPDVIYELHLSPRSLIISTDHCHTLQPAKRRQTKRIIQLHRYSVFSWTTSIGHLAKAIDFSRITRMFITGRTTPASFYFEGGNAPALLSHMPCLKYIRFSLPADPMQALLASLTQCSFGFQVNVCPSLEILKVNLFPGDDTSTILAKWYLLEWLTQRAAHKMRSLDVLAVNFWIPSVSRFTELAGEVRVDPDWL
ncbi:hypothetical protein BD779DRAFT_1475019 [Infundibulicybe gibba]|nr:hypothetical protein BD779DRAFT_1475019 [Infundibulicybe gibba]